jgi:N-methylhydantoinase B
MNIDLNLTIGEGGIVACRHCGATVGDSAADPMAHVLRNEQPSSTAGPGVHADPASFVDRPVVLRQTFCPGCLVLLSTEIVPADEPSYRRWTLA